MAKLITGGGGRDKTNKTNKTNKNKAPPKPQKKEQQSLDSIHERAKRLISPGVPLTSQAIQTLHDLKDAASKQPQHHHGHGHGHGHGHADDTPASQWPSIDDPNFQRDLQRKREFWELRATEQKPQGRKQMNDGNDENDGGVVEWLNEQWSNNCAVDDFRLTDTQLFVRRFVSPQSPYNGMLLFHGTGVGKTCAAVTVAEQFLGQGMRNGVLVITRPALREGFKRNIFNVDAVPTALDGTLDLMSARSSQTQCTGSTYTDRLRGAKSGLNREQVAARVSKIIRSRYTFLGPTEFANMLDTLRTKTGGGEAETEKIRTWFSDRVIIIDEAHSLRSDDNKTILPALTRVLSLCDNVKLLLLTATPMFNTPMDVIQLINLLRVNDKRPKVHATAIFAHDGTFKPGGVGEKVLAEACKGYISYMRGETPLSFPARLYPSMNNDPLAAPPGSALARMVTPTVDIYGAPVKPEKTIKNIEVCVTIMGKIQYRMYSEEIERITAHHNNNNSPKKKNVHKQKHDGGEGDAADAVDAVNAVDAMEDGDDNAIKIDEDETMQRTLTNIQQLCNVAYPATSGATFGAQGFDSLFTRHASPQVQFSYKRGVPAILSEKYVHSYASKIATIVERIKKSEGLVMVYSKFVWSGLVPLAIALEHAGLSRYQSTPLLKGASPVADAGSYIMITGDDQLASEMSTLQAARSIENSDGSVIKVILISERGSEGLDFLFMREIHIMEPWFNLSKIEQIVGRGLRHCSHSKLPMEKRNVTVYMHCVAEPPATKKTKINHVRETVDQRIYAIAEYKQRRIDRVHAVLRNSSVDCALNMPRLFFDKEKLKWHVDMLTSQGVHLKKHALGDERDSSGSSATNMIKCADPRLPSKEEETDQRSYDLLQHSQESQIGLKYDDLIRNYFATKVRATFDQLVQYISSSSNNKNGTVRRDVLAAVLHIMVNNTNKNAGLVASSSGNNNDGASSPSSSSASNASKVVMGPPNGSRSGHIIFRAGMYLFQPDEAFSEALAEWERTSKESGPGPQKRFWMFPSAKLLATEASKEASKEASTATVQKKRKYKKKK